MVSCGELAYPAERVHSIPGLQTKDVMAHNYSPGTLRMEAEN